jgi:hypothetical protein
MAKPQLGGTCDKNCSIAVSPPADAPMPTIGKEGLRAGKLSLFNQSLPASVNHRVNHHFLLNFKRGSSWCGQKSSGSAEKRV